MKNVGGDKTRLFWLFLGLWVIIIAVILLGFLLLKPKDDIVQGAVEADELRVSSKLTGRIEQFVVAEGASVRKGDTLAWICSPEIQAKLSQAKAAESAAEASNRKAINGARVEQIQGAFEVWQKAKVGAEIAQKTLGRMKQLFEAGVLPAQKYDEAEANCRAMQATERAAQSQYEMVNRGADREDKRAAEALMRRAQGAVDEVTAYLNEQVLTAPSDGVISEIFPHVGELVGAGAPIMSVVDLQSVWISFHLREDRLNDYRVGSIFTVKVPALGGEKFEVKVTYIKALGSYATWRATKTTGQFDVRTFEIRAVPTKSISGLRPGMSALIIPNK